MSTYEFCSLMLMCVFMFILLCSYIPCLFNLLAVKLHNVVGIKRHRANILEALI